MKHVRYVNFYPPINLSQGAAHPWQTTSWVSEGLAYKYAKPGALAIAVKVEFEDNEFSKPPNLPEGYAVVIADEIQINTVSGTERAAMVNGLVTIFRIVPRDDWSDERIATRWEDCCSYVKQNTPRVIKVLVLDALKGASPPVDRHGFLKKGI